MPAALVLSLCLMTGATNDNGVSAAQAFDCESNVYDISVWDYKNECDNELGYEAELLKAAFDSKESTKAITAYLRHWNLDGAQIDVRRVSEFNMKCEYRSEAELP